MRRIILFTAIIGTLLLLSNCVDKSATPTPTLPGDTMDINDTAWFRIGDKITIMPDEIEMGFSGILEEARCPSEYICQMPGQALITLWLKKAGEDTIHINPGVIGNCTECPPIRQLPVDTLDCRFSLIALYPYPANLDPIPQMAYTAKLSVSRFVKEFSMTDSVIITGLPPDSIELDPFELRYMDVDNDSVLISIGHSGGCEVHSFELYMSPPGFASSNPAQADLYLRHDAQGDNCEALINRQIKFDLRPVARLYQDIYGRLDPIQINVYYYRDSYGRKMSDAYFPGDIGK